VAKAVPVAFTHGQVFTTSNGEKVAAGTLVTPQIRQSTREVSTAALPRQCFWAMGRLLDSILTPRKGKISRYANIREKLETLH